MLIIHRWPHPAPWVSGPAVRPVLLSAQVTSTSTSMPEHRVGFQGCSPLMEKTRTEQKRPSDAFKPQQFHPVSCLCQSRKLLVSAFTSIRARAGAGTEQDDTGDRAVTPAEPLALPLPFAGAPKSCLGFIPCPSAGGSSVSPGSSAGDSLAQGN